MQMVGGASHHVSMQQVLILRGGFCSWYEAIGRQVFIIIIF